MNKLFTCAMMLNSLTIAYVQFMIMLIVLKKMLSVCTKQDYPSHIRMNRFKHYGCESVTFLLHEK